MAQEIELKLSLPASAVRRLLAHPLLAKAGAAHVQRLTSIYFDTPEGRLRERGIALRLRRAGRRWLQTVKCAGAGAGGLSARPEWETPAPGGRFDFSAVDDEDVRALLTHPRTAGQLGPVFETRFERRNWMLFAGESRVALMLDRGKVLAGGREAPICELEIELIEGSPAALVGLAREFAQAVPLTPDPVSKADRGWRLALQTALAPVKAGASPVRPGHGVREAFNAIAHDCLAQLQANARGARESGDPEFIHQMRVALRRLRSALRMFAPVLPAANVEELKPLLRELTAALGVARDWDVLDSEVLAPVADAFPGNERLARLRQTAQARRAQAGRSAADTLTLGSYGNTVLAVLALTTASADDAGEAPALADFAHQRLRRIARRVARQAAIAENMETGELHALRVLIKRLRYGLEFFAPLYPAKAVRRELRRYARLQEELGFLNDLNSAGPRLALCMGADDTLREAVALAGGWYGPRYSDALKRLPAELARLRRTPSALFK